MTRAASDLEIAMLWQLEYAAKKDTPLPEVEYRFAPPRRWRFDFAWPDRMLALEIEGGTFVGGRHSRGRGFEADAEKHCEAVVLGWHVLRVTGDMVRDMRALRFVERALEVRLYRPTFLPPAEAIA